MRSVAASIVTSATRPPKRYRSISSKEQRPPRSHGLLLFLICPCSDLRMAVHRRRPRGMRGLALGTAAVHVSPRGLDRRRQGKSSVATASRPRVTRPAWAQVWSAQSPADEITFFDVSAPPYVTGLTPRWARPRCRVLVVAVASWCWVAAAWWSCRRWARTDAKASVIVTGANFAPTAHLTCWFGDLISASVRFVNASAIECEAPEVCNHAAITS